MRDWPVANPTAQHHRAIFLDRDGTINVDTHYPHKVEELRFIPGALRAIALLAKLPLDIIIVTNQAGIGMGLFSRGEMSQFNAALRKEIVRREGRIDAIYYCPDRELKDLPPDEASRSCSKPSPSMLYEAAVQFEVDLSRSFLVGDKTTDIAAGLRAECTTILVNTGKAGKEEEAVEVEPNFCVADLYEAAELVKKQLEFPASAWSQRKTYSAPPFKISG